MFCISTDQTGRSVTLEHAPQRIVSLVPSQTELLYALGLDEEVCGITRFCVHPQEWFSTKTRVGGTKDFKPELIRSLKPDLIIANKEENDRQRLEDLMQDIPVWVSDVHDLDSALSMIGEAGRLCGREAAAQVLRAEINLQFEELAALASSGRHTGRRCVYYIWKDPWMCAGSDTFIADMLRRCGLEVWPDATRYPELRPESLKSDPPDLLLLSSEPYPFKQDHLEELRRILPETRILLVDGEYFSWYGARLKHAVPYFISMFA